MKERWKIQAASPADAAAIAAVHVRSWQDAYADTLSPEEINSLSVDARTEQWRDALQKDEGQVSVAYAGDEIVGFVATGPSRDDDATDATGEIGAIYLVETAWGRGIGSKLLDVGIDCLKKKGATEATLWVLEENKRARRFYAARGWVEDGAAKDCFGGVSAPALRYRIDLSGTAGDRR